MTSGSISFPMYIQVSRKGFQLKALYKNLKNTFPNKSMNLFGNQVPKMKPSKSTLLLCSLIFSKTQTQDLEFN